MAAVIPRRRRQVWTLVLALVGACRCFDGSGPDNGRPAGGGPTGAGPSTSEEAAPGDGNDHVAIPGPGPSVVVLNGKGRTACYFGKLFEGPGTIDLQDRIESPSDCSSSVAAFARDRAAQLDVAPAWSHDPAHPLQLTFQPAEIVPIQFYVPQGSGLDQDAKDEMDIATGLYRANRAGIEFSLAGSGVKHYTGTPVAAKCADMAALVTAGMYDPAVINVYYVPQVNGADAHLGYNCFQDAITAGGVVSKAENVIFLAFHRASTTLAHELGHALGLRLLVGHTTTAGGFTTKNLMMGFISWEEQDVQDHFSLGQVYRMSLDGSSWINHPPPTPSVTASIRKGATRTCQPTPTGVTGDQCPPLVLDK